jgi:peroxiredoxin
VKRLVVIVAHAAAVAVGSACAGAGSGGKQPSETREAQTVSLYNDADAEAPPIELGDLHFVGMDDGPVPDFRVRTVDGSTLDSTEWVGRRSFAVVFFATWCGVCGLKLDALKDALRVVGDVPVIGVAVDTAETWPRVQQYMRKHELRAQLVRATSHPKFAIEYNPFSTVPLVVVVGRNGGLVDFQLGYTTRDRERLVASLQLAERIGPLARPRQR